MSRKVINVIVGGSSNIIYKDVSLLANNDIDTKIAISYCSFFNKFINNGNVYIMGSNATSFTTNYTLLAIGIDLDSIYSTLTEESYSTDLATVKQTLINLNLYDKLLECPDITKEEFYDLTLSTE